MADTCSSSLYYPLRITADHRVFDDIKQGKGFTITFPRNCKKCRRYRKRILARKRRRTNGSYFASYSKDIYENEVKNLNVMKRFEKKFQSEAPLNWQTSPLLHDELKCEKLCNGQCSSRTARRSLPVNLELSRNYIKKDSVCQRLISDTEAQTSTSTQSSPKSAFSFQSPVNGFATLFGHKTRVFETQRSHLSNDSQVEDLRSITSTGVRCRYCLSNENETLQQDFIDAGELLTNDLISPCLCSGSAKYVHKSCLERWLTMKNTNECEVCKTVYQTKWIQRPMCSLSFPTMEKRDVVLLIVTMAFYITLILQFLGAVYLSVMATILPTEARIVTLIALSLGLFWFMIGSIMLTIILYTSEYWRKWRYANKRKIVILNTEDTTTENCTSSKRISKKDRPISGLSYELSLAVPV